jgi:hypothetical protein
MCSPHGRGAAYTVMTGTDTKTGREVCLRVTADYAQHTAEIHARRRLEPEFVVELFDCPEDTLGNFTMVLGGCHAPRPSLFVPQKLQIHSAP